MFTSAKFVTVHFSATNPCEYSVIVLKRQVFQDKHHIKSVANFVHKKLKTLTLNAFSKTHEDILEKARHL